MPSTAIARIDFDRVPSQTNNEMKPKIPYLLFETFIALDNLSSNPFGLSKGRRLMN